MTVIQRTALLACVALLAVSCSSKVKESQQVKEKLAKWEQEDQAQKRAKASTSSPVERTNGQLAEGIAARVNEEVIFISDVDFSGKEIFEKIKAQAPADQVERQVQEARRMILDRMVERTILAQEAQRRHVSISDQEVDEYLDRIIKQRGITKEQFQVQLARDKFPLERFKEGLKRDIAVQRLLDVLIRAHIHVTDQQCQEYYEKNREGFGSQVTGGLRIQQIILVTKADTVKDKNNKQHQIEEIRARILKGEDFGKMARQFSQGPNPEGGGDCGYFKRGELLPQLDEVAFSLKAGEVSPVIETSLGYHLLRVMEADTGKPRIAESDKEAIRAKLEEKAYADEVNKLLDSLKKSAHVDIRL